jgi:hypothetical protein
VEAVAILVGEVAAVTDRLFRSQFKGTPHQKWNQFVQAGMLKACLLYLYYYTVIAMGDRQWDRILLAPVLFAGFYFCNRLIKGRLGELLNGKRENSESTLQPSSIQGNTVDNHAQRNKEHKYLPSEAGTDIYSAPRRIDRSVPTDQ